MGKKDIIHERRVCWQKAINGEYEYPMTLGQHLIQTGLDVYAQDNPVMVDEHNNPVHADDPTSEMDAAQLLSHYYHIHPGFVGELYGLADHMDSYDLGWAMIGMPVYPRPEPEPSIVQKFKSRLKLLRS